MRGPAILLLLLAACPDKQDPLLLPAVEIFAAEEEERLEAVTVRDYKRALARLRLEREDLGAEPLPKELRQFVLEQMIEQRVLAIEAARAGVKSSTVAVAKEVAVMKRSLPPNRFERFLVETYQTEEDLKRSIGERLVAAAFVARETKVEISEEDLKREWEKLPEERRIRAARVHAAQIMVPTEDVAQTIVKKLRAKPDDFAELARAHSVAPEAEQGGDLGWFEKGDMPAVFDQVCFTLPPGQISDLTPSELGYHVFKVIEREEERPLAFEEAKERLLPEMRERRQREKERELIASLLSRYRVVRHEKRIAGAIE